MRVLLQGRSARSIATSPGGDQVLIEETADALRRNHGVDAVPSSELEPDLSGVDAVHLFGIVRPQEVWLQARNARRQGKPIFLSTVYCDVWDFEREARDGMVGAVARHTSRDTLEAAKALGRVVNNREYHRGIFALLLRGFTKMQHDIIRWTDVFLPNSESEWRRMEADLRVALPPERVKVIPNGVDLARYDAPLPEGSMPAEYERYRDCVLCVGRVEARKNQLTLVEALSATGVQLVLAGPTAPNQASYEKRLRKAAGPSVHILGGVSDLQKRWLYQLARVHVLPSWLETTGLSTLEAAISECTVVVSPNGDTREYFGDEAEYCDPGSEESIRDAVMRARARPPSAALVHEIRERYSWSAAADATYTAYAEMLGR